MRMRSTSVVRPRDFTIILMTLLSLLIFFPPISALARPLLLLLPPVNAHEKPHNSRASATPRPPPPPPSTSPPISPARSGSPLLGDSHPSATPRPPPPSPSISPPSHQSVNPIREMVMVTDRCRPMRSLPPLPRVYPPTRPASSDVIPPYKSGWGKGNETLQKFIAPNPKHRSHLRGVMMPNKINKYVGQVY
ncbi:hypothetical protein MLD38_028341 [Melastoma candidum]|uniref:Uncharacterized protein n=1 Tax=Melastoma candidum TaxID=119954 RepID=A0ACB9N0H6_9MYRT|nr:hypothetical protein MLD38_028341 [Melastoma candidum]